MHADNSERNTIFTYMQNIYNILPKLNAPKIYTGISALYFRTLFQNICFVVYFKNLVQISVMWNMYNM